MMASVRSWPWFARRPGRFVAVVAAFHAVASAQEGGGRGGGGDSEGAGAVTVPLAVAGLQYTANVEVSSGSLTSVS